jgi:hypothetical protein
MAISKQFKSLNLGKKKEKERKLCTDEVRGVKMKKMKKKKKAYCNSKKHIFFTALFGQFFLFKWRILFSKAQAVTMVKII